MVKKLLCSLFSAFAMSFALNVSAQTFYAGLSYSSSSDGCIYSFDLSDVSANTGTVLTFPYSDSDGSSYLLAGTTVENSYYGFLGTDWGSNYFASINFETGAVTRLATTNVATVRDMTYDPVSKEVYCLQTLTTSSGANSTKVFTLDIATGDTATYFTIEGMAVEAIAADGTGKAYALGFVQTGFDFGANAFDVALYTVDFAAKTCEKVRDLGEFAGSRNYNSLVLNEGTLYYIGGNQMFSINPAEGGMVTVGKLPSSYLSGLTFTKSTTDAVEFEEPLMAYLGVADYGYSGGDEGRIISIDLTNSTEVAGEYCLVDGVSDGYGGYEQTYVKAGAAVKDGYYAYMLSDYETYSYFAALDFENNVVRKLADVSATVTGSVLDMAYDATANVLYAIRNESGNTVLSSVDRMTGALTEICTLEGVSLKAIAVDDEGTLYAADVVTEGEISAGYTYTASLYTIDTDAKTCTKVRTIGALSNSNSNYTMAWNDGKLYFATGRNIVVFEPQGTDFEEIAMPFNKLRGLSFTKSTRILGLPTAEEDVDDTHLVRFYEVWGSAMGDVDPNMASKRKYMYYDANNNLVREALYGRSYDSSGSGASDSWSMMNYYKYDYDAENRLVSTHSEQWGQYSGEDFTFKATRDTVNYEYDGLGRLVKEIDIYAGTYTKYEYDDEGQLVYEGKMRPDYYSANGGEYIETEGKTYSNFIAYNKPQTVVGTGSYAQYNYYAEVIYDENLNEVRRNQYSDATKETLQQYTVNTFRSDSLVETVTYSVRADGDRPISRITYECVNGDPNVVRKQGWDYNSSDSTFTRKLTSEVFYYADFGQTYAPTGLTAREVEGDINSYELSFNAPEIPSFGDVYYNLYRNGFLVRTIAQNSEEDGVTFDAATGRFTFVDPNLPNGRYDYFVQTVIKDEVGDSIAYNVSNPIYVTPETELPAATNLRVVKYGILNGSDLVTVAWDAPEYTDEHRFERYNVFITELGMRAAENNEEDGQPTEYTLTFRFPAEHIYVQTQYYYGKVNSDTIYYVLNEHEPDYTDGIEAASAAESVVKVGETAITVDGVASSMAVYTAGGAVVASAKNASSLDIASLQRGVYIAIVDIDRRHYVVKFTK